MASLRVRLTALVTLAVGLALVAASVALVTALSRSLVGEVEQGAAAEVDRVAEALGRGEPLGSGGDDLAAGVTMIVVQDEHGAVRGTIPPQMPAGAMPLPADVAEARARAITESGGTAPAVVHPSDDVVMASRTVSTPQGERVVLAVSRLGPVGHSIDVVVTVLLVSTPLLTAFVALLTWLAVDRALRPIEAVRRRAEAISHSTLDERLPEPYTGDEVQRLTATLNEMLGRLDDGARHQREFVSAASHELRTPLTAMRAELEISLAHRDSAGWRAAAGRLLHDHQRLERLTGDLLTLARNEDAVPGDEPVRLDEIVAGELGAAAASLSPVEVRGSAADLARLVRNLVGNAERHAGTVVVDLATADGQAVLRVDDDGPGVPAEFRERVFDRFFRIDGSRDRGNGGVGLGLALVRAIARRHGGDVTAGVSPLGGARFEVRLPLR